MNHGRLYVLSCLITPMSKKLELTKHPVSGGHNYVSLFVDLEKQKTIFATEGKDSATVELFKDDLSKHHGDPEAIADVSCDMSPALGG